MINPYEQFTSLLSQATALYALQKAVFSKPADASIQKAVLTVKKIGQSEKWQIETFHKDNKATHENLDFSDTARINTILTGYHQVNMMTTVGSCELKSSKSGTVTLLGDRALSQALASANIPTVAVESNEKEKHYILNGSEPFLIQLGVSDKNGRIHDKRQSKFRQINRFLELVRDVEGYLDGLDTIHIADLCCGKSYLSFAVYHYFAVLKKRKVQMIGVDLKSDVIDFCEATARALHYDGLHFYCADVNQYEAEFKPDIVVSLHACDIATDIVLNKAIAWNAKLILSTPCCQHELNHKLNCPEMDFIAKHSMLRQKFCEAATDSLRLLRLEAAGYEVAALELIDPEDTPKNILLRGIKRSNFRANSPEAIQKLAEYERIKRFLMQDS